MVGSFTSSATTTSPHTLLPYHYAVSYLESKFGSTSLDSLNKILPQLGSEFLLSSPFPISTEFRHDIPIIDFPMSEPKSPPTPPRVPVVPDVPPVVPLISLISESDSESEYESDYPAELNLVKNTFRTDQELRLDLDYQFATYQKIKTKAFRSKTVQTMLSTGISLTLNNWCPDVDCQPLIPQSPAEEAYIEGLIKSQVIAICPNPKFVTPHFFRRLPGKLRIIFDGRRLNKRLKEPPYFRPVSVHSLLNQASKARTFAKIDLRDAFFAIRVNQKTKPWICLNYKGKIYHYNRVPFGLSWSPFFCHIYTEELREIIVDAFPGIRMSHYLDDFWIWDIDSKLLSAILLLLDNIGVVYNPKKVTPPTPVGTILGIPMDLGVSSASGFMKQLNTLYTYATAVHLTHRGLMSLLGYVNYYNYPIPGVLAYIYPLFKPTHSGELDLPIPKFLHQKFRYIHNQLLQIFQYSYKFQHIRDVNSATCTKIYTDAYFENIYDQGIGLTILEQKTHYNFSIQTFSLTHIFILESLGVFCALTWIAQRPANAWLIYIDNQALYYSLKKGGSKINLVNFLIKCIVHLRRTHVIRFAWVPSNENLADGPSRLKNQISFSQFFQKAFPKNDLPN